SRRSSTTTWPSATASCPGSVWPKAPTTIISASRSARRGKSASARQCKGPDPLLAGGSGPFLLYFQLLAKIYGFSRYWDPCVRGYAAFIVVSRGLAGSVRTGSKRPGGPILLPFSRNAFFHFP